MPWAGEGDSRQSPQPLPDVPTSWKLGTVPVANVFDRVSL